MGDIIDKRKSNTGWSSSVSASMKIEMGSILITENVSKVKKMWLVVNTRRMVCFNNFQ